MEKNIKDYLHLYLGCDVLVKEGCGVLCEITKSSNCSDRIIVRFKDVVTKYYDADGSHVKSSASAHGYYIGYEEIKLLLRPLSSMNDEEMNECGNMDYDFSDDPELNTWTPDSFFLLPPNQFIFLLSKHFDLFGLIEAGLAIDKTTLSL